MGGRPQYLMSESASAPPRGAQFKRSLMSKAHIREEDLRVPEKRRAATEQPRDDRRRKLVVLLAAMAALAVACVLINYAVYS